MNILNRGFGAGGCETIANTTERTGKNYEVIVPLADTVFTSVSGTKGDYEGSSVDFFTTMGMSGVTYPAGIPIFVPSGSIITNIELASGSVLAYLKNEV